MKLSSADLDVLAALLVKRLDSRGRELPADLLLRPFFESKEGANLILNLMSLDWKKKWSEYFRRYGCLRCERGRAEYASCGLCVTCHGRIVYRLRGILRDIAEPGYLEEEKVKRDELRLLARARRGQR
jgi:hypothetical protein